MRKALKKDLTNIKIDIETILEKYDFGKIHEINQYRDVFGEYSHLFGLLRKYEDKFKQYMRMLIRTFDYILSKIEKDLTKDWCNVHRQPILPEQQLAVTIRFLATGMSYGDLGLTFRMEKSTVCELVKRTMEAIWENLYRIHMPVPTVKDFYKISDGFAKRKNLPHCIGAVDVRQIRIKKPNRSGSQYYNYKHFHSIAFQAIVGPNDKYISIDVGGYGSQHDSTTFRASTFYDALQRNLIKLPKADRLPVSETVVPYFLIGDCAYPLMEHLLKPYPGTALSNNQKTYNSVLSGARTVVECCFGQDCQRFRIYYKMIECQPDSVEWIAKSISIIHNVIIDKEKEHERYKSTKSNQKDTEESEGLVKIRRPRENDDEVQDGFPVGRGHEVRENMKKYIVEHPRKKRKL